MKKVLAMGLILALCLCGCGEKTGTDDLEKFTWGMTRDEVIEEKGSQPDETKEDGKELVYKGEERYGLPCDITYGFYQEDRLDVFHYIYSESHEDIDGYKSDFDNVSTQLREDFGEPVYSEDLSDEEHASSDMDDLMEGIISYEIWKRGETSINHTITDIEGMGLTHSVYYRKN